MRLLDRFSIKSRLLAASILTVSFFILFSLFSIQSLTHSFKMAAKIHDHPLKVSNASHAARIYATRMHRSMNDVVLARNEEKRNEAISAVNKDEKEVYSQLDIIRKLILGKQGKELERETRELFAGWKPIREKIIKLAQQGKNDEAAEISMGESAAYYDRVADNNQKLNDYAIRKADTFMADLESHNRRTTRILWAALLAASLLTMGSAAIIFRSILSNLNVLKNPMDQSTPTGRLIEAEINGFNEITDMAASYNALVKALSEHRENLEAIIDKRTEELNGSLEWFATTLRSIGDAVITTDNDGTVSFMNPIAEELTGWTFWEARDKPLEAVFNIINEQTRQPVENPVKKVLETGAIVGLANHTVLISKDGREYPIVDSGAPIRSLNKDIGGVILVFRDNTEQRDAEKKLQESENRYKTMFENMNNAVAVYEAVDDGSDFVFRAFNRSGEKIEKKSRDDLLGRRVTEVFPGVREMGILDVFSRVWRTGEPEHFPMTTYKDQRIFGWRDNFIYKLPSGEVVAIYEDVTEKKQAETALRESQEWLSITLRSIGDAVVATDSHGKVRFMNPVAETLTGWRMKESAGLPLEHVFHIINENTREKVENPVEKVIKSGEIVGLANHTVLIAKNGIEYPIVDSGAPIKNEKNEIIGVVLVFRDDSERRTAESELQAERNTLDSIMESIPDLVTIHNLDCELTYMNGMARKIFGDRIGEKCYSVFENRDKACSVCPVKPALRDGKTHVCIREATLPSGEKTYWENTGIPIKDTSGQIVAGIEIRKDITERIKTENTRRRMREQEKHAVVGRVAGKMAHDFNNVLGIILGTSELLMSETLPSEVNEEIDIIKESALRGREITRNLLMFAKDQEPKLSLLDINEKISTILKSLKSDLITIDVTVNYGPDLEPLLADAGLIESAVVNLIQNAIHALSKTSSPKLRICTYREKTNICIEIEDNGCGIPGEYVDKVFDPLFTLKGSADRIGAYRNDIKGNGYGLANVKRSIDKHNGTINLHSDEGEGAKFKICLPVIKAELNAQEMRRVQGMQIPGGKKILLVEDETHLARILYSLLGKFDHSVDLASDARMALDHAARNNYDAISLDFILPDMNGMDVYKRIRETNKDIPIIFVSGNFEFMQSMLDLKKQDPNVDHISKPFENVEYLNMMHKWLGSKDNATNS